MAPRRKSASVQHTVAVIVCEQTSVFELAVPCEVFGLDRSDMGMPAYDFMVCGVHSDEGRPVHHRDALHAR